MRMGLYSLTGRRYSVPGEHDLTSNISHWCWRNFPRRRKGSRWILVRCPKFVRRMKTALPKRTALNGVSCARSSINGIRASATCVITLDGANRSGWRGEKHKGMRAMFTMMNTAPPRVGMPGLGIAEVAYQNGLAYARTAADAGP